MHLHGLLGATCFIYLAVSSSRSVSIWPFMSTIFKSFVVFILDMITSQTNPLASQKASWMLISNTASTHVEGENAPLNYSWLNYAYSWHNTAIKSTKNTVMNLKWERKSHDNVSLQNKTTTAAEGKCIKLCGHSYSWQVKEIKSKQRWNYCLQNQLFIWVVYQAKFLNLHKVQLYICEYLLFYTNLFYTIEKLIRCLVLQH